MRFNEINIVAVLVWESDFETISLLFQEKFMQRYIFSVKLDLCKVYFITDYNAYEMFT